MISQYWVVQCWKLLVTIFVCCLIGYTLVATRLTFNSRAVSNLRQEYSAGGIRPQVRSVRQADYDASGSADRKEERAYRLVAPIQPALHLLPTLSQTFVPVLCPAHDDLQLHGKLNMAVILMENDITMADVTDAFKNIRHGRWAPTDCVPRHKIAIIIPFRDRTAHLALWLSHVLPILQRQKLDFTIIVVEQKGTGKFNKGRLFNAAFTYAESLGVNCIVLQDVDLFPEDDRLSYGCSEYPTHMGAYVNTLGYRLMYSALVGGVLSIQVQQYRQVNGFSNEYWGWGGEDDDMAIRLLEHNLTIARPNKLVGRYTMLKHESRRAKEADAERFRRLYNAKARMKVDGLNQQVWYMENVNIEQLYHHLLVDVKEPTPTTQNPFIIMATPRYKIIYDNFAKSLTEKRLSNATEPSQ